MISNRPGPAITGFHHVGHVVRHAGAAVECYRRLGFVLPPLAFPSVSDRDGGPAQTFGVGNAHLRLGASFVEVTVVADDPPPEFAVVHPIEASAEALPQLRAAIADTSARLRKAVERFEGLHILAFSSDDVDAAARTMAAAGIRHGGVQRLRRPARPDPTGSATPHDPKPSDVGPDRSEPVGYLELDRPEGTPEGRLAVAEPLPAGPPAIHPNGAIALIDVRLRVPSGRLAPYAERYRRYLERTARPTSSGLRFDLGGSHLIMEDTPPAENDAASPAAPAFTGYTVAVSDLAATTRWLRDHRVPYSSTEDHVVVAADQALGAEVIFVADRSS